MKLFKGVTLGFVLVALGVLVCKALGVISLPWIWVILISLGILVVYVVGFLALAIWVIQTTEWE